MLVNLKNHSLPCLVRDKKTGKSKGFAFICYENQKSTILAVDNFNGVKLTGRTIRVDHVEEYKLPKVSQPQRLKKFSLFFRRSSFYS